MRPGTNTTIQSQLPPSTPPVNTGTWFIAGITSQGPVTPQLATSLAQWQAIYGQRGTNPLMSDSVETYFNEGGSAVYTGRVVGPAAAKASIALNDASAPTPLASITVAAEGPGVYANGYQVVVADGSNPLAAPSAPVPTTAATGGTVAAGVYKVAVTYVNALGETVASAQGTVTTVGATSTITVPSPSVLSGATGWYAYVSQVGGTTVTRQQPAGSPSAIGAGLTLTATPSSTGTQPFTNNTTAGYTITIEDASSNVLEVSNLLATVQDAVNYGVNSQYAGVTATGTNPPAPGTFVLTGGVDDIPSITTTQYQNALATFTWDLGPGQVSAPGVTTAAVMTALAQHANSSIGTSGSRVAYCDLQDSNVAATLTGAAAPIRALGTTARRAALWTPWFDISPTAGSTGNRAVPPSAFAAGRVAANDAATGNPNQAAAGIRGILKTPVNIHATFSDTDRQTLNTAGVNVIRNMAGGYRIYGNVTAVDRNADPLYFQLANVRLDMTIESQAQAIQEEYVFSQIDGAGIDASQYGNELVNMLSAWVTIGALFIGKNGFAFTVDTSGDVNTLVTEALGQLIATIAYVRSPGAEQVNLNIVRSSVTQGV